MLKRPPSSSVVNGLTVYWRRLVSARRGSRPFSTSTVLLSERTPLILKIQPEPLAESSAANIDVLRQCDYDNDQPPEHGRRRFQLKKIISEDVGRARRKAYDLDYAGNRPDLIRKKPYSYLIRKFSVGRYDLASYIRKEKGATKLPNVASRLLIQGTYVVTLTTTTLLHQTLTSLRQRHHPQILNRHAAHICLFSGLPDSELTRITEDIQSAAKQHSSFPLRAAQEAIRIPQGLIVPFDEGTDAAAKLHHQLKLKWQTFIPPGAYRFDGAQQFYPSVTVQDFVRDGATVDASLEIVNAELRSIGKQEPIAAVEDGGGTIRGLATGFGLFRVAGGGRYRFLRRYVFNDVPTRGWDKPESMTIPVVQGVHDGNGFFPVPEREGSVSIQ